MTLLPYEKFVIESTLTKEQVLEKLIKHTEPEKTFRWLKKSDSKEFEGYIRGDDFELKRIIGYRNSFLPVIKGRIESGGSRARLRITMRLQFIVIIFLAIWSGFIGLFFLIELFAQNGEFNGQLVFPIGMLLFGYILTMGGYLFEATRGKDVLQEITEGRLINVME